jgi:transposase InsO family protein
VGSKESDRSWLVEHRYRAVLEVAGGAPVTEVAGRYGVSRQTIYAWKRRHERDGVAGLAERSRRPRHSPCRLAAEVEALVCELRRAHPRWGARRISYELGRRGVVPAPARATVHRALVRNHLVQPQEQRHRRKYRRWQRQAPMELWQLDLVDGVVLVDGRTCKLLTGLDDHSRYCVIARVLPQPTGRAVCEAFAQAMGRYGIPAEVLSDNGKQFTGRFTKPRPAEVLFERLCRLNGITQRLTRRRSPTTTGKVERFHQTLQRELLDHLGPFADVAAAQAAIDAWVDAYNHQRPHQALGMATPVSRFAPATPALPAEQPVVPVHLPPALDGHAAHPELPADPAARAVELELRVPPGGTISLLGGRQQAWLGPAFAGRTVTVWADARSVHLLLDGHLVKTLPSRLSIADVEQLAHRGARPAGPPPAAPALPRDRGRTRLPAAAVVEVARTADRYGIVQLAGQPLSLGAAVAGQRVTLRLDGHLLGVVADGRLRKTLPAPIPPEQRARLRGAHAASSPPPPPPPAGQVRVQRRVPRDGVVMVARQRLRVGAAHAGKVVTVVVEDTHLRVLHDGEELSAHPRTSTRPIRRWKADPPRRPTA